MDEPHGSTRAGPGLTGNHTLGTTGLETLCPVGGPHTEATRGVTPFIRNARKRRIHGDRKWGGGGVGVGEGEVEVNCLGGPGCPWGDGEVPNLPAVKPPRQCEGTHGHWAGRFEMVKMVHLVVHAFYHRYKERRTRARAVRVEHPGSPSAAGQQPQRGRGG